MNSFEFGRGPVRGSSPVDAAPLPTRCPTCRSLRISTTARNPDEHAYWRCDGCGDVWNASRRASARNAEPRWR